MATYQGPLLPGQDQAAFYQKGIERSGGTSPAGYSTYDYTRNSGGSVLGASTQVSTPPPSQNNSPPPVDLSNDAKKDDYARSFGYPGWNEYQSALNNRNSEAEQASRQKQVDEQFNPIFDIYNQAENNLKGQYPGLISEAEAQARASRGLLDNSKLSAQDMLNNQQQSTIQGRDNQTADQRRTYQELQMANRQRFGGASSAGVAANELQGREFQRNTFQIGQQAQQALQQVEQKRLEVDRTYQQSLQQLEVNTQKAKGDLQRSFQDKLLEINSGRANTASQKAAARMEALQQLRNEAYQIDMAKMQFAQQLQMQREANAAELDSVTKQWSGAGATSFNETPTISTPESAIPSVNPQQGGISQAVGQINSGLKDDYQFGTNTFDPLKGY